MSDDEFYEIRTAAKIILKYADTEELRVLNQVLAETEAYPQFILKLHKAP